MKNPHGCEGNEALSLCRLQIFLNTVRDVVGEHLALAIELDELFDLEQCVNIQPGDRLCSEAERTPIYHDEAVIDDEAERFSKESRCFAFGSSEAHEIVDEKNTVFEGVVTENDLFETRAFSS
jgi:hypothetical protein